MLRTVHYNCAGMDVHKKFIAICIAATDFTGVTTYKRKKFATLSYNLKTCRDWFLSNNCSEVCMESNGKYWIPILNVLEDHLHVVVPNPKYIWAIKGKKTRKPEYSPMTGIPCGLPTFSSLTSSPPVTSKNNLYCIFMNNASLYLFTNLLRFSIT